MITNDIMLSINRSVGVINTSFKIQKIKKIWKTGKQ